MNLEKELASSLDEGPSLKIMFIFSISGMEQTATYNKGGLSHQGILTLNVTAPLEFTPLNYQDLFGTFILQGYGHPLTTYNIRAILDSMNLMWSLMMI